MRNQKGAALVVGASSIILIMSAAIGLLIFLINSTMASYYKQQISFIATQAAACAPAANPDAAVKSFVTVMEQQMNIGSGNPQVTVTQSSTSGSPKTTVTIKDQFKIIGIGKTAWQVSLQATGVTPTSSSGASASSFATASSCYEPVNNSRCTPLFTVSDATEAFSPQYSLSVVPQNYRSLPVYGHMGFSRCGSGLF